MKKLLYFVSFITIVLTSCEETNLSVEKQTKKVLTQEQQQMRTALELTTNIMIDMISNDRTYFEKLYQMINLGDAANHHNNLVMMKDIFTTNYSTENQRVKALSNKFTDDFKTAFIKNKAMNVNGNTGIKTSFYSNPDSLIQYLNKNNVCLYCPYPIERYEENNRIPAISFHPMDNDSVNLGYVIENSGQITTVSVCQAYNDLHPVWILLPYEEEEGRTATQENIHQKSQKAPTTTGYEVSVVRIYCKQYYGGIFDGDLNLHIIRANPASLTYVPATNSYTGGIATDLSFRLPRSYITDAKRNWWSGWYDVNTVWDTNWDTNENSSLMYIYEWDKKGTDKESVPLNTYDSTGHVIANIGNVEYTSQSQDQTIGLQEWSRYWFFDIIQHGNPYWYWTHSSGNNYYVIGDDNLIRICPDFLMTMKIREY